MRLLILTQYFPPEIGAPQNRLFELALRLHKLGVDITVLTAMPNYPQMEVYEGYRGKRYCYEEKEGLKIHRSAIYVSKNKTLIPRLRNYFSFVVSAAIMGNKKIKNIDLILCESPPLFLGYAAMFLARRKKAKLIFNVSDLWPESAEKLGVVTNQRLLKMAYDLERKLYQRSVLVTGQTQGICDSITRRFPSVQTYWLPNGVDLSYYDPSATTEKNWRLKNNFSADDFILLYAGIIGIAQGLEIILEAAKAVKQQPHIKFLLLGSGPEKEKLVAQKSRDEIKNVFFMNAVGKTEMPGILASVNAAVIPLRKLDLFKGAIPSKIFETLAMKVPILLGVDGEARELFIDRGRCGIYFEPENVQALAEAVQLIAADKSRCREMGDNGRKFVNEFFNRDIIAKNFYLRLKQIPV